MPVLPEHAADWLSGSGTKGFRDALHVFGRGLTEMDRMQVRERLSVELLRWRARLYGH